MELLTGLCESSTELCLSANLNNVKIQWKCERELRKYQGGCLFVGRIPSGRQHGFVELRRESKARAEAGAGPGPRSRLLKFPKINQNETARKTKKMIDEHNRKSTNKKTSPSRYLARYCYTNWKRGC